MSTNRPIDSTAETFGPPPPRTERRRSARSLPAGTRLGRYEVQGLVGSGGMGEVYKARDTECGREVAIKALHPWLASSPTALARFEREARAVSIVRHPGIVVMLDFFYEGGEAFSVTELLEGETLRAKLDCGPLPQAVAIDYARQVAEGLAAAHEKGIVHRDLKPDNVFITSDGCAKVLDFGLAKWTAPVVGGPSTSLDTEPGMLVGTVGYMSPEQVRGQTIDHRSDIFAFGVLLYEMLVGKRAFLRDSAVETMAAILTDEPPNLQELALRSSPALERMVRHCLQKDREERFQSTRDVAFSLGALTGGGASQRERYDRSIARLFTSWGLIALGVLAGACLGG